MKNVGRILLVCLLMLPFATFASTMNIEKQEAIAMFTYLGLMGLAVLFGYLLYKRKAIHHSVTRNRERFRYKTFQLVDHGKKIVLVKRYHISE